MGIARLRRSLPDITLSAAFLFLLHVATSWGNGLDTGVALRIAATFVLIQFSLKCISLLGVKW